MKTSIRLTLAFIPMVGVNLSQASEPTLKEVFADAFLNPLAYILDNPESLVTRGFDNFQEFAPSASGYLDLREQSDDLYIFMRNLHLQGIQRDAQYK